MLKDFKAFIMKGNLVDIAAAFIMAVAFGAVVAALVADVFTPLIAAIIGKPDFSAITIGIGKSSILIGSFINVVINFLVVAFVVYLVLKANDKMKKAPEETPAEPSEEVKLLTEIRDQLARRP